MRSRTLRSVVLLTAVAIAALAPWTPADAQKKCYTRFALLNGECPEPCGYGDQCPCVVCILPSPILV